MVARRARLRDQGLPRSWTARARLRPPVPCALENALYQWQEGERGCARPTRPTRDGWTRADDAVLAELRQRLGSTFTVAELADLYAAGTDWAADVAPAPLGGRRRVAVVDAAFARYAREAADFAGGRDSPQ